MERVLPHERHLLSAAARICPTAEDARDLVQDVLTRMLTLEDWDTVADPRRYMLRMIRNMAIDRLRRAKVVNFQSLAEIEDFDVADDAPDQHRLSEDREMLRRLSLAVQELPDRCRVVFQRCRVDGASPREVACELSISLSTLEKRLARAIVLLTGAMTPDQCEPVDASFALWTYRRKTGSHPH